MQSASLGDVGEELSFGEFAVEGVGLVEEVGDEEVQAAVSVGVPRGDAHASFGSPVLVDGQAQRQRPFAKPGQPVLGVALMDEVEVGDRVVGQEQAELSRAGEVGGDDSQAVATRSDDAGF